MTRRPLSTLPRLAPVLACVLLLASPGPATALTILSSNFDGNNAQILSGGADGTSGNQSLGVAWQMANGVILPGGDLQASSPDGGFVALQGNTAPFANQDVAYVNYDLAPDPSAQIGYGFGFFIDPNVGGFALDSISIDARHADAQGSAQGFSSVLNVLLMNGSDPNQTLFMGSSQRTYSAGATDYQTITFDTGASDVQLLPATTYVMLVSMSQLDTGNAYASYDGVTLEGTEIPEPSSSTLTLLGLLAVLTTSRARQATPQPD